MKAKIQGEISRLQSLNILDFGCGIGVTEIFLKKHFPNAKIFGVDTSLESVKSATKLGLNDVEFMRLQSSVLPFKDGYFDLIYSNGTFHHIEGKSHIIILKELCRVLKDGGHLFIFENNPFNPLMMRAMRQNPFDKDAQVIYPKYLKSSLKNIGFQFKTINYYFFYPRLLNFLRFTEKYFKHLPIGAQYFVWVTK